MVQRIFLLLVACLALMGCGDTIKGKSLAEPEVAVFHQRLNQKKFEEIYAAADTDFRKVAPKDKVLELFAAIDKKLGTAKAWTTKSWNVRTFNLTTTVVLVQETTFERGQGTETFTYKISNGKATLMGYNINSLDMLTK